MKIDISKFFNKLCNKIAILLLYILVEFIILIWKLTSPETQPITTRRYLKFIEEKNPTIRYTKKWNKKPLLLLNMDCSVCLCDFEEGEKVRRLKCKHAFHKDCLDKWLQDYLATCPLCREQVLPEHVVSKHREHRNHRQGNVEGNHDNLPYVLFLLRGGNTSHWRRYA
ncbi:unnamed protein product [Lathyrus oleraceus]|nr:brassinosteroid-responsive RING protein 1-like [Pisum sativum]